MGYTKQNFADGQTLKAEHLIKMEEGIINAEKSGGSGTVDSALNGTSTNPVQNKVVKSALDKKQDTLVSGTNIKTVNGQSLLGSGNIAVEGGGTVENVLSGKKILAIGDSFVKGHTLSESQTWVAKIANRNNMTYKISAINGAPIAYKSGQTHTAIVKTIDSTISANPSMDYVVLMAGHNDANPDLNGGKAIEIGSNTDNVDTTFKGALNIIIGKLLTAYPTAKILFLTPFLRRDNEELYVEAMKEICGIHQVPCFDNYHSVGLSFKNSAQAKAYELSNSLHLNEAGQERISYVYESLLKNGCAVNYSTPSGGSAEVDLSGYVTTTALNTKLSGYASTSQIPFSIVSMSKEEFDALETKLTQTLYFVQGYGVYLGTTCIISTDNQTGSGGEEEGGGTGGEGGDDTGGTETPANFVALSDLVTGQAWGTEGKRVGYTVQIPSGATVDFKNSALWDTYKYAIAEGSSGISSTWIGGGYQTGAYTTAKTTTYSVMIARQDDGIVTAEEVAGILGYTVTGGEEGGDNSGTETPTNFVAFSDLASMEDWRDDGKRACYVVNIPTNATVDFKDSSYWETYHFAIGEGTNQLATQWIGGGYRTESYTTTKATTYSVMMVRKDDGELTAEEVEGILGYTVG